MRRFLARVCCATMLACLKLKRAYTTMDVFASPHYDEAIKHVSAAAGAGDAAKIVEHTLPALEHTMVGALNAKGLTKSHTDEAVKALEAALDLVKNKKATEATASVQAAVEHLKAANTK